MSESLPNPEDTTTGSNNKALGVLFLAVFVDLLGFGLILPIMPFWVNVQLGQSELMYGFLVATFSIFQFIFAPIWGRISDSYGRRPVILIGLTGTIIGFSTLTLAAIVVDSLFLIFLARAISGVFTAATLPTSQAFISDSTTGKDRAKGFGLIGAAFGLGFAFGPAIGGISFVIGQAFGGSGYVLPTLVAVGFAIVNLLVAIRNIPETLTKQKIEERKRAKLHAGKSSRFEVFGIVLRTQAILLIILIFTILNLSFSAMEATFALFGEVRFGLDEAGASIILLIVGIAAIFTQGGLVRPLSNKYPDAILTVSGYIIITIAFLGLITTFSFVEMAIWAVPLAVGSGLAQPTLASLLSKNSPVEYQGTILGLNQSMASLMRIFGPLIGTFLLTIESAYPYIFSVILLAVCIILAIYLVFLTQEIAPKYIACHNCGVQSALGVANCSNCGIDISML
ncbi:MAG: MFS transporter [Candidatus Kariarchaeaceae archaeon]|jgi:MFS family permease